MEQDKKIAIYQFIGLLLISIILGFYTFKNNEKTITNKKIVQNNFTIDNSTGTNDILNKTDYKLYNLKNNNVSIDISNKGGQIKNVQLKNYYTFDGSKVKLIDNESNNFNIQIPYNGSYINTSDLNFELNKINYNTILLSNSTYPNHKIIYQYKLDKYYGLKLNIFIENHNNIEKLNFKWTMKGLNTEKGLDQQKYWSHTCYKLLNDNTIKSDLFGKDEWRENNPISLLINKQQFFAVVLKNKQGFMNNNGNSYNYNYKKYNKIFNHYSEIELNNNKINLTWEFIPLDYNFLKTYKDKDLHNIIDFGWGIFGFLNKYFFLKIFTLLSSINIKLGIVIMLMTIVVKLLLSPIMYKQYYQSAMMKVLKPDLNAINEKYKNPKDSIRKQQEIMNLYKVSGINPFAGCLPALLQIPIFYSLFKLFPNLIYLRGISFSFIKDLTAYDEVIKISDNVPFLNGHISILASLYVIAMIVYLKVSGSIDNVKFNNNQNELPNQNILKYLMIIMPLIFFIFLNNYASGLSLYYLVSNTLNIILIIIIKRFLINENKIKEKINQNKKNPIKQSKFSSKIQELMKLAEENRKTNK